MSVVFKKRLAHFRGFWEPSHVDICASRGFSTLMSANWPLMSVNLFLVGYGAPWSLMLLPQHSCGNGRQWRATHAVGNRE